MFNLITPVLLVCVCVALAMAMHSALSGSSTLPSKPESEPTLLTPSKLLLDQFRNLPVVNQPYSEQEFISVLRALDVLYRDQQKHLRRMSSTRTPTSIFTWSCGCADTDVCPVSKYHELRWGLIRIENALKEQKRALELAGVQTDLERVQELYDRLNQEAAIVNDVTKALVT